MKARNVLGRVPQLKLGEDVMTDAPGCARREGRNRKIGEVDTQRAELAIFRTKLVSPFRNAVSLINGKICNRDAPQQPRRVRARQSLRREIQQTIFAGASLFRDLGLLARRLGTVQDGGGNPHLRKLRCLVLHQCDQRRNYNCSPPRGQRGQLVTQRLAAPSGHDDTGVAAAEQAEHNLFLQRPERAVAPVTL